MKTFIKIAISLLCILSPQIAYASCFSEDPKLVGMQPGPYGNVSILYRADVDAEDAGVSVSGTATVWFYVASFTGSVDQSSTSVPVNARARRGSDTVDILLNVMSPMGRIVKIDDVDFANVTCH